MTAAALEAKMNPLVSYQETADWNVPRWLADKGPDRPEPVLQWSMDQSSEAAKRPGALAMGGSWNGAERSMDRRLRRLRDPSRDSST
jgi:hypothetical protein